MVDTSNQFTDGHLLAAAPGFNLRSLHGFVGGDLSRVPYISPFGALLRLTRLNRFARKDVYAAFGFRLVANEDPAKVLAFSQRRLDTFSAAIGIDACLREGWRLQDWLPFQGEILDPKGPWKTRACLPCLREGFHAWLFQMPWANHCPWHGVALVESCPSCARPLARGFIRGGRLMHCECGIDFFNRRAALKADPFHNKGRDRALADYLDWAKDSRTRRHLICPEVASAANQALAVLAAAPAEPAAVARGEKKERPRSFSTTLPAAAARTGLELLSPQMGSANRTIFEVPTAWIAPLRSIADGIARRVPRGALFPAEARQLVADGMVSTGDGAGRTDIMYLPVQTAGERAYLLGSCLPKPSLVAINQLLRKTEEHWDDDATAQQVLKAVRELVFRAYADGLRIVLGRHIPALYDHPRLRPWEHAPWIAVTMDALGVSAIQIAWTRENPDRVRPTHS